MCKIRFVNDDSSKLESFQVHIILFWINNSVVLGIACEMHVKLWLVQYSVHPHEIIQRCHDRYHPLKRNEYREVSKHRQCSALL